MDSLAKLIDSINNSIIEILKDKRLNQKYERRDGKECHITAASIINPGEVSTEFDWNKNVNIIKTILKDSRLIPFKFSFDRLHVGVDGIVVLVGYPDSIYVRNFKENIFNKFNAERWWMDFSVAPAIGVFDVDISCEEAQSILKSIKLPQQRVLGINNLFVIHYRNRRIIPEKDVISISKIF